MPPPAVKHRMVQDNVDPMVLDMDPNGPSPNHEASKKKKRRNGSSGALLLPFETLTDTPVKKKKKSKISDGLVRKKIHWKKLSGTRLQKSIWGRGAASASGFGLATREIKEMTALFCQSMNPLAAAGSPGRGRDLGADQQGARRASGLGKIVGGELQFLIFGRF